jgi:hypothetical protein
MSAGGLQQGLVDGPAGSRSNLGLDGAVE